MHQRLIPILLMTNRKLVKTKTFRNPSYVGDPRNVVRIFSDFQADELILFDIEASKKESKIDFDMLEAIAIEARMPISYGGGVTDENAGQILSLGFEKIVLNSNAYRDPSMITRCADKFGSQAVAISMDVRENQDGYSCWSNGATKNQKISPIDWAKKCVSLGAGEIILTVINREGTWSGTDLYLSSEIANQITVPLVTNGGVSSIQDISKAISLGHASAVAAGSFFVYQREGQGVLISYPTNSELNRSS
jgi:cyclase